jgi:hypothetical protein
MPRRITANSIEIGLTHCRKDAVTLDDELLLYLIDIILLHLRRKAGRPENNSAMDVIRSYARAQN